MHVERAVDTASRNEVTSNDGRKEACALELSLMVAERDSLKHVAAATGSVVSMEHCNPKSLLVIKSHSGTDDTVFVADSAGAIELASEWLRASADVALPTFRRRKTFESEDMKPYYGL